jgi:hypothetical protein
MNWPPETAGDLPAPRDDEPSSLRQDIADELADHLQSSFTRELHFTPEETAAKQSVLDRFGDPRRVARQLWFDAMKEKLMSQRLNLVLSSLMTAACLGALALMGLMLRESRLATQALLEQSQAANAALLDRLAALAAPAPVPAVAEPAKSMEWNSVKIRLVKEKRGGPPAEGFEVRLHGHLLDTAKEIVIVRTTSADGIADMGLVRPGQHSLDIRSPWNETRSTTLTVLPGQPVTDEIVCPAAVPVDAATSFSVNWPDDLRPKGLWLVAKVLQLSRDVGGDLWRQPDSRRLLVVTAENHVLTPPLFGLNTPESFRFTSESPVAELADRRQAAGLFYERPESSNGRRGRKPAAGVAVPPAPENDAAHPRPYHIRYDESPVEPALRWPVSRYRLDGLLVVEAPKPDAVDNLRMANIVGGLISNFDQNPGDLPRSQSRQGVFAHPFSDWVETDRRPSGRGNSRTPIDVLPTFEIQPDGLNRIVVEIPPRLADHVRKFLEATN